MAGSSTHRPLPPVLAHYMPWFQFDAASRRAGSHWTMNFADPRVDPFSSAPRVAAHTTPLIGPYDSRDRRVIRYHLELMRRSGIRGVVINWYGTRPAHDFAQNLQASDAIVDECCKVGLLFTVCYEDWTVVDDGASWTQEPEGAALAAAQEQLQRDFEYLRDMYMARAGFLCTEEGGTAGRPLLLCFGPRRLQHAQIWESMLSTVFAEDSTRPLILSLNGRIAPGCRFAWFPRLEPACSLGEIHGYLREYYGEEAAAQRLTMGPIWACFHDYYAEGSGGKKRSYGYLPSHDGHTAEASIDRAKIHQPAFVQLCTWNDWQEGTSFEPSKEFGYYHLLKIQRHILGAANEEALKVATESYLESVRE